jgi:tetratricopeptide (TPR) repeat protein
MSYLDGLYPYEVAMLAGGVLLFLVVLILLVISAVTGKPFAKLFIFFGIAIVMIGFPSYSKIEISKDGIELEKNTDELRQNPTNQQLRNKVSAGVTGLSARNFSDPKMLSSLAEGQIALGENSKAQENITKALRTAPHDSVALDLQKRLQLESDLVQFTTKVRNNSNDDDAKAKLSQIVTELGKTPVASPVTNLNLAYAHSALGNQSQAAELAKKAIQINPDLQGAVGLQEILKPNKGVARLSGSAAASV